MGECLFCTPIPSPLLIRQGSGHHKEELSGTGALLPGMGKLYVGMCPCHGGALWEVLLEHGSLVPPLPIYLLGLGGKENREGL